MSTIKVDTIATRTGSGNITLSNNVASATIAGDLTVDTNTLKVDSSNNRVGIGTSSPSSRLHLKGDAYTPITIDGTSGGTIDFYRNGSRHAQIFTDNAGGDIIFRNNTTTEKLRILSSGGITFNGDTAVANALDDYEEGTWTATAGTGAGTVSSGAGVYTKIGRVVYVSAYLVYTGASTSGNRTYGGLPFPVLNHISASSIDFQGNAWSNQSAGLLYFDGGTTNFVNNHQKTFQGSFTANDYTRVQGFYFTT